MKTCPSCQASYPNNYAVCPQDGTPLVEGGAWAPGAVVRGKYRILSKIGQGGMGSVYKALHVNFEEERALKVISPELLSDALFVKRFKHEAVITRRLQHPNAVRVDDIDEAEDGRPFIVMECIEGKSLKKIIQEEGALPVPRVCAIVKQVAAALDAAHQLGMVHRDIKPDNIVLIQTPRGEQAKVLDFGIAKIKEGRLGDTGGMTLTGTGVVIGTPQYMSPEQAMGKRGDQLDGRSDLYSLGVVMYEMLTGDLPFKADTTMEMLLAHLQKPPLPIRTIRPELQIPDPVAALVMRLLEKKPELRPATAKDLIEEIERSEAPQPPPAPTRVISPRAVLEPERQAARVAEPPRQVVTPPPPPPAVERRPAAPPVARPAPPPPRPMPVPVQAQGTNWGLWIAAGILVAGLGGGTTWYILTSRAPTGPEVAPVESRPMAHPSTSQPGSSPTPARAAETKPPEPAPEETARETERPTPVSRRPVIRETAPPASSPAATTPAQPRPRTVESVQQSPPPKPAPDPKKISAAIKLGDLFFDRGEYENAIAEYQRGLNVDPSNRELGAKIDRARRAKAAEDRLSQ